MTDKQYRIGEEDKMELYREFFKAMIDFGYAPFFIGQRLAEIVRAVEMAEGESD